MKITSIGHASLLIEAGNVTVLSDPWWRGPCFGAQWWLYPPPATDVLSERQIDYIYISHGHHDHFHPGTLRTLSPKAKVLVSRRIAIANSIRELGFDVIEVDDDVEVALAPNVNCRVMRTHGLDTLMTISDGREVCINLNDALHSAPIETQLAFVSRLKALFWKIDYVYCGYGVASHFPNCYEIPGKDREATAIQRQKYFNANWVRLIEALAPRFGFPFAADVVLLDEDLFWLNEPTHNSDRPTTLFEVLHPDSKIRTIDIAPGFSIENGRVVDMVLREPIHAAALCAKYSDSIARANRLGPVTEADVHEVAALVKGNLESSLGYLKGHAGDYRFLIRIRNSPYGIGIAKCRDDISLWINNLEGAQQDSYDIVYRTRLPYLKWSLTRPFGDEILFVGSGGIFEYRSQADARRNLHREFKFLLTRQRGPVPLRKPSPNRAIKIAKDVVKLALGRKQEDLYDLGRWTTFRHRIP